MIKTISCVYKNTDELKNLIKDNVLYEYPNILIQIFSSNNDLVELEKIQEMMCTVLPQAKIMGCTTSGDIVEGYSVKEEISISFTIFEKTELRSSLFNLKDYNNISEMGKNIVSKLCDSNTKALILFSSNYSVDLQQLLDSIHEGKEDMALAGGIAGEKDAFREGFIFDGEKMSNEGVVVASLNNPDLQVQTFSNFKFQEVGKSFKITKATGTTIVSIDQKKPSRVLENYLGKDFLDQIKLQRNDFPFLLGTKDKSTPIWIKNLLEDGTITVSDPVSKGDSLVFAYAHLREIIDNSLHELKRLSKQNVETIFAYNCASRKRTLHEFATDEIRMLNSIAPTNGFFANGEIAIENGKPHLVGHSLTFLALSENSKKQSNRKINFKYNIPDSVKTIVTLTHLMKASQEDLEILNDHAQISEQHYRSLFDNNTDIVYSTDLQGNFTSVNPAFEKLLGYKKEELLGKLALNYINEEEVARVRTYFYNAVKGKEQHYNIEVSSKTGEFNLLHLKNIPITVNGECVGIYGIGRNITEQKKIEDKIIQLAYYDQDTGLPNRIRFTEMLSELLQTAKKKNRKLALMVVDIDRFKIINDSLGHDAGDEILKEISGRIQASIPSGAFLGRFNGDKFNLILSKNVSIEAVIKIAKSILHNVAAPIHYSSQEFYVTASIGVSLFPTDGTDEITLMKNADIAMNRSKSPGGNRLTLYSNEMNEEAMKRLELESYLRKALKKNEFFLCYQPLIDLKSGKLYGSEALIRWNHPVLGLVSPGDFIPLAEETGLIEEIGSWVLRTACKQNKMWQQKGLKNITVSVNVSANQFQQTKFVAEVIRALAESGLEPKYLTLELTESTMLRNIDHSIEVMQSLQKLGVRVSIDDFGTGYSSLSYLKDLPINNLKIDRSFINNLRLDTSDIAIVKAIITMSHGLAVKVVAEGVETEEQIELLKKLKCHYAQGFYLHRPLTSDDFERVLIG
ncbi:bifunctional diguanylate cyclase/phosphodiesterase [Robertmurraya kyonggiensis]|uniref:EAL domain-containing protein n=1 Tax=Robertmurraya kyonggiensis TaxID=1037680 RepID=A0A4U1D9M8_9BACI|nr:EAL domain-containing protein [Robertmurraya kyonggiensis]TKC18237.1 EAL domain-containing protein [Robertmurraya kyonggiensis]